MTGRLTLITGPMFAGKTTKLVQTIQTLAQDNDKSLDVIKPAWDSRYATDEIVTHSGLRIKARNVKTINEFDFFCDNVVIDEVQFFHEPYVNTSPKGLPRLIKEALDNNTNVVVAGLRRGANGHHFEVTHALENMADEVIDLRARCFECNAPATETQRLPDTEPQVSMVDVGGKDKYQPVCRAHFKPTMAIPN